MAGLDMHVFGARLLQSRQRLGLSQSALAERSGVGQNQISRLERGDKPSVRADTLYALAKALGVSTDYLLGLEVPHELPVRDLPLT